MKRVGTGDERKYLPVAINEKGRCTNTATLKEPGVFVLDWYVRKPDGGWTSKRKTLAEGTDLEAALASRERQQLGLQAEASGHTVTTLTESPNQTLRGAVAGFLEDIKLTKKPKTLAAYTVALNYFVESCQKTFLSEIVRKDLLKFAAFLRDEKDQSPRSVYNKFEVVMTFLKSVKLTATIGIRKEDWPVFTDEEVEVYSTAKWGTGDDLEKFFAACTEEETTWFRFFLMTGMREQEVMYCYWKDLNLHQATVRVSYKPDRNWTPKAYKEREIPIPSDLVAILRKHKETADKACNLLFPTTGCKPKLDFLDCCKAVAKRAGLNPDGFWLHKFRASFATFHLWNGVDLRTVQSWMGHSDLESTMRYLKPRPHDEKVKAQVNGSF
jgi:integrase/recombinase XerD